MIRIYIIGGVPSFEEGVSDEVTESLGLHGFILFESVEVDLLFHSAAEGLDIGAESAESHDDIILHFEDSLEIVGEGQHLLTEPSVRGYSNTIFSDHSDDGTSIVLEYTHNSKVI